MLYTRLSCLIPLLGLAAAAPQFGNPWEFRCEQQQPHAEPANERGVGDLDLHAPTSPVGQTIANILLRKEHAEAPCRENYRAPGLPGSTACKADTCCIWSYVSEDLKDAFKGCNKNARAAIRLGFHDAGTWSAKLAAQGQDFGGADGSVVLSPTEISRPSNKGLENIARLMAFWQKKWDVPMSDLIQFAATHAVVSCPLGPRIRFFVGRTDSSQEAPDGLLPSATSDATTLIELFEDKTISPHELVALVGAHTTSRQANFDPNRPGTPQDSSPVVWDVLFYNQTLQQNQPAGVTRLPSDIALAKDPRTSDEWAEFQQGNAQGQKSWNVDYAIAYIRMSLIGVKGINEMTECSKVLPNVIF